ncbi:glycogen synthase GlgA [Pseudoflavonifractor phocaeensis]|uniref:glycogen synthase GlgA n=1 Tax=Pseudoflavonifractor phocaeensis TaxID=1870988 RepID=UPI001F21C102|nr:glycogen synthase GlgA [Pseudoflavonifractor phocaeensis]MCF2595547.1 glycogen synthase GlgA [Pseudoflavonifractor phocaeensis]
MKILFASPEVAPFIKTGGLADVAGSLPQALAKEGHEVKVILPLYEGIGQEWRSQMTFLKYFNVTLSWRQVYCGVFQLERDGVTYWFVDNEYYFKRWQIYGHFDDCERFAYFSRAVIETPGQLDWAPDIIHCNDWQTALVPVYLLEEKYRIPQLANAKSVFTIHNIEYQGRYGEQVLKDVIGLDAGYFNEGMLAYFGDVNLMKGAIMASNFVTTVSPTYAQELRTPFYAKGLDGVINQQAGKIEGILNGIDMELYDPATNPGLAANFTTKSLVKGKKQCKLALQKAVGLQENPDVPIIACISRLVGHKGFSLVTDVLHEIMGMNVQMVVLGTGDWQYEEAFRHAQSQYPGRFAAQLTYSAPLSTMIYAGADLFLMPSISEPCGLSQIIAMRFGTVPVVRETGGLKDTVTPYNKFTGEGRGFTFSNINAGDMVWVLREAVDLYHSNKEAWRGLQRAGMTADFSWTNSAKQYLDIYQRIQG